MSYASNLSTFSRTKIWYVEIDLDFCQNTYGSAPCTAAVGTTGSAKCYNTFGAVPADNLCQDPTNYVRGTKTYRFSSHDTPLPFSDGERPYIMSVEQLPTEIKPDKLTTKGRVKVRFLNEPDNDVGIDPYVGDRTSIQGRFWHKLFRRNPNYKGKPIRVYEGFEGDAQAEYKQRFAGTLDNFTFSNDAVILEAVDFIGDLRQTKIPFKYDIELASDINSTQTSITFAGEDVDTLGGQSTGKLLYLRINDEMLEYNSSNYDSTANVINPITRGFKNSRSTSHGEKDKVTRTPHYGPGNAWNIMLDILQNDATDDEPGAGISSVNIATADFSTWRDWAGNDTTLEVQTEGWFTEEMSLDDVYFGLISLYDAKSWVGEDLKITVRRNVPNLPGRSLATFTDTANIVLDSDAFNGAEEKRYTRKYAFWNWNLADDEDKTRSFTRRNAHVGADEESTNFFGEAIEDTTFQLWAHSTMDATTRVEKFVSDSIRRDFAQRRRARPIVNFQTETKDSTVLTGDYVYLNSDVIENVDGTPIDGIFQVIKREVKDNKIKFTAEEQRTNLVAYITSSTVAGGYPTSYDEASDAQKREGWISGTTNPISSAVLGANRDPAMHIY